MDIRKLCQVCEGEPAFLSCRSCGRLAGKNCRKDSLCKDCAKGPAAAKKKALYS